MTDCSTQALFYIIITFGFLVLIYFSTRNNISHDTCFRIIKNNLDWNKSLPILNEHKFESITSVGGTSAHSGAINAKPISTEKIELIDPYMTN